MMGGEWLLWQLCSQISDNDDFQGIVELYKPVDPSVGDERT